MLEGHLKSPPSAPAWLEDFQRSFSSLLREPLESRSGTLESRPTPSWSELAVMPRSQRVADAGLADYHRQYWFRLLSTLQHEFPLTARLMGLWSFNLLAQKYLVNQAPQDYDLQSIAMGFPDWLLASAEALPGPESGFAQAVRIDAVRSQVFLAPAFRVWERPALDLAHLSTLQLKAAPDWQIVVEDWAFIRLVLQLDKSASEASLAWPEPHEQRQYWLIRRDVQGLIYQPLPAAQALLYKHLCQRPVTVALSAVLSACHELPAESLAVSVQTWIAQSINWNLWAAPG